MLKGVGLKEILHPVASTDWFLTPVILSSQIKLTQLEPVPLATLTALYVVIIAVPVTKLKQLSTAMTFSSNAVLPDPPTTWGRAWEILMVSETSKHILSVLEYD